MMTYSHSTFPLRAGWIPAPPRTFQKKNASR